MVTNAYRQRADGRTSWEAAFGFGYRCEILPFAETCLFKVPTSSTKQIVAAKAGLDERGVQQPKGDSTMVRGMWVGKAPRSDDHLYLV